MTVKELIEELAKMPPNYAVQLATWDDITDGPDIVKVTQAQTFPGVILWNTGATYIRGEVG